MDFDEQLSIEKSIKESIIHPPGYVLTLSFACRKFAVLDETYK